MATPREIKRRMRSVGNIAKVTGALEAVSAAKVRKAQADALASRAYADAAHAILNDLAEKTENTIFHPLLETRETIQSIIIILITSDRGLAGAYNANIFREALSFAREFDGKEVKFIALGAKGRDLLYRNRLQVISDFSGIVGTPPTISDITPVSRAAMVDFVEGLGDEIYIAYTKFINTLMVKPTVEKLLPLKPEIYQTSKGTGPRPTYLLEPNQGAIVDSILPDFTELYLYQAVLESLASEHSARMVAMRNATENAHALESELSLSFNKARQLAITSEMLDIVGGAGALDETK